METRTGTAEFRGRHNGYMCNVEKIILKNEVLVLTIFQITASGHERGDSNDGRNTHYLGLLGLATKNYSTTWASSHRRSA